MDIDYPGDLISPVHTYFRLKRGADIERIRRDIRSFIDRHWSGAPGVPPSTRIGFTILPVSEIHLGSKALFSMRPAGDRTTVLSLGLVALLIVIAACMNFVNLMIARTSRRTREIGVRKALGAGKRNVVWLLMWQFAKPVLWANVIAWPIAEFFLSRWLVGFTDHIELPWWLFATCGAVTLLLALAVVSTHALRAAGARTIQALREE